MAVPCFSEKKSASKEIFLIYIVNFLFSLHLALPSYVTSTFLAGFASEQSVGLLYTVSSILSILFFISMPRFLERFGNYKTILFLFFIEVISLAGLAIGNSFLILALAFMTSFVSISLASFGMDIFVEECSPKASIGKIRGFFLTIGNSAWVLAPVLVSLVLLNGDYYKIYFGALALMIPVIGFVWYMFKNFRDPHYHKTPYLKTLLEVWKNKNILDVFMINFLLQFFFAWMVIYIPLYLHGHIGFSWSQLGVMFSIMLLPFALFELPLGRLADKFGEKEILSIGFIITAVFTGLIPFLSDRNFIVWTIVLFMTRVGAAMLEVMSETYFFKKVPDTNVNAISFFRTMRPWAYLISPLIASVLLYFLPIKYLFMFLGLLMFYGLRFTFKLKDTR